MTSDGKHRQKADENENQSVKLSAMMIKKSKEKSSSEAPFFDNLNESLSSVRVVLRKKDVKRET